MYTYTPIHTCTYIHAVPYRNRPSWKPLSEEELHRQKNARLAAMSHDAERKQKRKRAKKPPKAKPHT